jgi:probable rRNA maturation factor
VSQEPPSTERPRGDVDVVVIDEQTDHDIDSDRWARLAAATLASQGVTRGELTVTFVDEDTITALNIEHMGGDGPTDVLSFPLDHDGDIEGFEADPSIPSLLGDVVVCPAVAAANAAAHATASSAPHPGHPAHDGSVESEIDLLVVHGVLHLLGHDHAEPDERERMLAAERAMLSRPSPTGAP